MPFYMRTRTCGEEAQGAQTLLLLTPHVHPRRAPGDSTIV